MNAARNPFASVARRLGAKGVVAVALALLLVFATAVGSAAEGGDVVSRARALLGRLGPAAEPAEFAKVANEVGPLVDEVRQAKTAAAILRELRDVIDQMRQTTNARLGNIESDADNSEAALEALYRSRYWDDLSFALGAFPYWRAWLDLELARMVSDAGLKAKALLPAQRGFRAASMQLFRPGLVYGGWLGLGYCDMELGKHDRAAEIFRKLDEALAAEPDSPVRQAVQLELRLLDARQGKVDVSRRGKVVDGNELAILKAEAFVLLQESRKTGGRPTEAAERLKTIIRSGQVDQALVQDMMTYAQELSGVDIGPYTDLAGAEFALANEHWYDAMQKYQRFFNEAVLPPKLDLSGYRYRWAVAAYKQGIYQPAIDILEQLLRKPDLPADVDQSASKLLYAVLASRDQRNDSAGSRQQLRDAAQRYVRKNPNDADADSARLMIAQTATNAKIALQQLGEVKSAKYRGDVERTAFQIMARDFSDKIGRGSPSAASSAALQGIQAFQKLAAEDKKDPYNFAVLIQMRALVDPAPAEVLKALDEIERKGGINNDIQRAMVWARLELYDRMATPEQAIAYVRRLASAGIPSWQVEYLYPWLMERKSLTERLELARLLQPAVADQPDMDRRLRNLIGEALLEQGEHQAAYTEARAFAKQYPTSGDAWKLLARAAEAIAQPFEADSAWTVLTDKAIPTMPVWWEGMLARVRIRFASTRPDEGCRLLAKMIEQREYLPADYADELAGIETAPQCAVSQAGAAAAAGP